MTQIGKLESDRNGRKHRKEGEASLNRAMKKHRIIRRHFKFRILSEEIFLSHLKSNGCDLTQDDKIGSSTNKLGQKSENILNKFFPQASFTNHDRLTDSETSSENSAQLLKAHQPSKLRPLPFAVNLGLFILVIFQNGANAKSKEYKGREDNETEPEEEETFWGQDLELSPEVWIILVFSVVVFWILLAIFLACFCGPNFVECQLCEQQVPRSQWTKLDHRETCAKDHERFLTGLPKIEIRCPRCSTRLKQWPKLGPKIFKCRAGLACLKAPPNKLAMSKKRWKQRVKVDRKVKDGRNDEEAAMMPGGGLEPVDVENTGENRFCCFSCDFSICSKCIEIMENAAESSNGSVGGSMFLPNAKTSKTNENSRRSLNDSLGSNAWKEPSLLKTISREVELKQFVGSKGVRKTSITQVRPSD